LASAEVVMKTDRQITPPQTVLVLCAKSEI